METPCIRICAVHPALALCVGCGRTLDEIARWVEMTADERSRVMAQLPARLAGVAAAASTAIA
jgi:uncharacterized protein